MSNLDFFNYYGENSMEDAIVMNVVDFLKYGLLEIGAYYNISKGQTDYNNNNISKYRMVSQPGITDGKVWEGLKQDLIWESGITLKATGLVAPISISGIYVNDTFYPLNSTSIGGGYYIDYNLNRIKFNTAIASTSKVEVEHSLRHVCVYSTDTNFYRDAIAFYNDRNSFFVSGSGVDNTDPRNRVYLPAIFVHLQNYSSDPMEIGSRGKYVAADLAFDIFTQSTQDRKRLVDICFWLEDKTIQTYDVRSAPRPLTPSGTLHSRSYTHKNLIELYPYKHSCFSDGFSITKNTNINLPIQNVTVRGTFEIPLYP